MLAELLYLRRDWWNGTIDSLSTQKGFAITSLNSLFGILGLVSHVRRADYSFLTFGLSNSTNPKPYKQVNLCECNEPLERTSHDATVDNSTQTIKKLLHIFGTDVGRKPCCFQQKKL